MLSSDFLLANMSFDEHPHEIAAQREHVEVAKDRTSRIKKADEYLRIQKKPLLVTIRRHWRNTGINLFSEAVHLEKWAAISCTLER